MVVFPNAKINLGLDIISKREDGYHNISSCFYPIPLADILEVLPSTHLSFTSSGIEIPGEGNLCIKAFELIKDDFNIEPVNIHLHKIVPIGAGLGGGSSDASFTLKCLNEIYTLNLSNIQLEAYAAQLGSDCPFFIDNKPVVATDTGTQFKTASVDLGGKYLIVLNPGIHISTAEAYSGVKPQQPELHIEEIISKPLDQWQGKLKNDFENSVLIKYPEIGRIKEALSACGASYTSMTGSGSSVYGIFEKETKIPANLKNFICWQGFL
ncbi:MAG: 4-(cytidine 5'-diphospho)-2-C-methyl-D-erythritol kinase [Fulvivirga sp.]